MHRIESDVRKWSHDFLEVPNEKLNGLPPCPYAKQAWLDDKVVFSINTGLDGLAKEVADFESHDYDIVVWANEVLPDMHYLDGWCDGVNEAMSIAGKDMHLMVFHPDYDAEEAGLDFLVDDVTDDDFLQLIASLENYSQHPIAKSIVYQAELKDLKLLPASNVKETPGIGIEGIVDENETWTARGHGL